MQMDATETEARRQRGLMIAATARITYGHERWFVPSQTSPRRTTYSVRMTATGPSCSCPDYELRGLPCKHIFAVEFVQQRETAPDGTVTETRAVRVTYAQNWPAYNAAQTGEKEQFCRLLRDLCAGVPEPAQTRGRPRLALSDMLFSATFKVYSTVSGRRFMTDLRDAQASGYVRRTPHYNSIFNYLENEALTPIIHRLIEQSCAPLAAVETDFAVDSTGFGTSRTFNYYSHKYFGKTGTKHDWLKLHAMVGVKTNVVTSVVVTDHGGGDATNFAPLVESTAERFTVREVSADKAYSTRDCLTAVDQLGATPFIPFKKNAVGDSTHALWNKLFHYFSLNREDFVAHYHKRSNVEATFSAIKRKFGDAIRSKTPVAQTNEVLLKVLCHNIVCLVHAMHELDITPMFRQLAAH
jgi:transposase